LAAVRRYDILDTPADGSFDRITAIAARRFNVPISVISIVDHDRIWFKSHHGLSIDQIGIEPGLCSSAIMSPNPYVLVDAAMDPRSIANPLVAGMFGLRFYVGVPLQTSDGYNLGTLCIIDRTPRPVSQDQIDELKDLAALVMDQMELRLSARRAIARAEIMAREIDHRVMNSLQFISTMLTMQSRVPGVTDTAEQLDMAANRVAAVARVHRHLYSKDVEGTVCCITFLRRLCADLSSILGKPIAVYGDEGQVLTTRIQPIGLVVNELVTNAAKHGTEHIEVAFSIKGDQHELSVRDDGTGLPPGFDPDSNGAGLGMRVVTTLAKQLGGRLTAGPNPAGRGSYFTMSFPA
jgi:two-component sensor histidine kinase